MRHRPNGPSADLLITPAQAAALLSCDLHQLRQWRAGGTGPTYYRIGRRLIRYSARSVTTFNP